jgi:N4-gp56 family major capsid protein
MALMTIATTELAHQFQTIFNRKLLSRARQLTVLDQFGLKQSFPKNAGSKTMRFFRQEAGAASEVSTLNEGVPLTTYTEVGLDYVEATIVQYGMLVKISDVLGMTGIFDTLNMSRDRMAENADLHADQITRNAIIAGVTGEATALYAGGAADFTALSALTGTTGALQIQDFLRAMTLLDINRAPRKNGEYFAVVSPQVAYDLMLDTKFFIPVNTYQDKTNLVKGEVGKWFNVRVVKTTVPFRETSGGTEGTYAGSGTIYSSIVVGAEAYGVPIMEGGSPYSPHVYINDKADKADPLNQFVLAGFKTFWTTVVLNAAWAVVLRSKSSFA